ncbi:uncharacterized protein, partial [Fopius arisanus]|uniref:Uncharacterized protein n=1 Tax=Fopius arisanus TaxID=64838 RepID=A0A9R1U9U3_9HYME
MIRARLRLIGRFLAAIKHINPAIPDLASVYTPTNYDSSIDAVRQVAQYDTITNIFRTPTVAANLGTYLTQIGEILMVECIKRDDDSKLKEVKKFMKVHKVEFGVVINKRVMESQAQMQRHKKIILPLTDDIKKLVTYLNVNLNEKLEQLSNAYSYEDWLALAQLTMASIVVYNRRRTGEISNILVDDYQLESIDDTSNKETFSKLTPRAQKIAKTYSRFLIRGKKNRTVPVLLKPKLVESIDLLLKYREAAGVPKSNNFLFAEQSFGEYRIKVLSACNIMRKFANACGASNPHSLTGTNLRKHIATICIHLDLSEIAVNDLSSFLGHDPKIHRNFYRQPQVEREILQISPLLEAAQGKEESDDGSETEANVKSRDKSESEYDGKQDDNKQHKEVRSQKEKESDNESDDPKTSKSFPCYAESENESMPRDDVHERTGDESTDESSDSTDMSTPSNDA